MRSGNRKNEEGYRKFLVIATIVLWIVALILIIYVFKGMGRKDGTQASGSLGETSVVSAEITETETVKETHAYPAEWEDQGVFKASYDQAYEKLSGMTLEEKVGQMLFVRCPETNGDSVASQYHLGGYVLFARDFDGLTAEQVTENITSYQAASDIPMIIGVDEEGGTVVRVSSNPDICETPFLSPMEVYNADGFDGLAADAKAKADVLSNLGINLNLAPVADVCSDPSSYIYDRTLGLLPEETGEGVAAIVKAMKQTTVSSTLKHFPGYGDNIDTHTGIAIDDRESTSFEARDFVPFKAGIDAGVESVLVSHNIVNAYDSELPASLSEPIHNILRNDLGFTGVIMTDDMAMDAIGLYTGDVSPYILAVSAGNNMLITTDYETAYQTILDAVSDGTLNEDQINQAVFKVLAWKYNRGIIK